MSIRTRDLQFNSFWIAFLLYAFIFAVSPLMAAQEAAILTLLINGDSYGDIEVMLDDRGGPVTLPATMVIKSLHAYLNDDIYEALSSSSSQRLDSLDLEIFGMKTSYDLDTLTFSIRVPASLMKQRVFGEKETTRPLTGPINRPVLLSAFANWRLRGGFDVDEDVVPWSSLGLVTAVNLGGWVGEFSDVFTVDEDLSNEVKVMRFVKDVRTIGARLLGGYIDLPRTGQQARFPVVGLSLSSFSDASLAREAAGSSSTTSSSGVLETIDLDYPATISISINGVVIKTERVSAGRYSIGDLPFTSGLNDVVIKIQEEGRPAVERRIGIAYDGSVLKPGGVKYGVGVGSYENDISRGGFSGFLTLGTPLPGDIGASLQFGFGALMGGLSTKIVTPLGLLSLDGNASWVLASSSMTATGGLSGRLQYRLTIPWLSYFPRLGLGFQYASSSFMTPSPEGYSVLDGNPWRVSLQVSQRTPVRLSFSLAADYGTSDGDNYDFSFALGATQNLGSGTSFTVSSLLDSSDGTLTPELSFVLSIMPPGETKSTTFTHTFVGETDSFNLSSSLGSGPGSLSYVLALENPVPGTDSVSRGSASAQRIGHRVDLNTAFSFRGATDTQSPSYSALLGASGAFVFANGLFGISRTVNDSFALLKPDASFGGVPVELRLGPSSATTSVGGKTAVLSGLSSYTTTTVIVDTPGSPPDVAAADTELILRPTYKSGLVIRPARKTSVYVQGTVVDAAGTPIPWAFGEVHDIQDKVVGEVFSDEKGVFEIYELDAGSFIIKWVQGQALYSQFSVKQGSEGEIQLGALPARTSEGGRE